MIPNGVLTAILKAHGIKPEWKAYVGVPVPRVTDGTGRLLDKRLAQRSEGRSSIPGREAEQSLKHLPCDERVAGRGVTIVRDDAESLAQTIQREVSDRRLARKCSVPLQEQRQIHGIQTPVEHLNAPMALVARVEGGDVMADVMAHNHPVAQILKKSLEGSGFFDALAAGIAGHAVDGHRRRVV